MINGRRVITLCGSTRFRGDFERLNRELTLQGNVVLSVAFYTHQESVTNEEKTLLDDIHICKIDLSDAIFVINRQQYVGESTRREIAHALHCGKDVLYLEPPNDS
jgi:ABC-type lipopolysaccharide export system ATPase subunit